MKIGFFDSGIGGLFILRHVIEALPEYHYVFLGDTVNVPYGGKTDEEIYSLVTQSLRVLFENDCSLVIFACNTASVTALRRVQDEFLPEFFPDRKVLGMIIPTVEEILSQETKSVALIATERTIHSGKYEREILARNPDIHVISVATPELVPLIEEGKIEEAGQVAIEIIQEKILPFSPDTLVLGCTHYGLLREILQVAFSHLRILSQENIVPKKLKDYLDKHPEIERHILRDSKREFFLTKVTPSYESILHEWMSDSPLHLAYIVREKED